MAVIVNIVNKGSQIEIINPVGIMITFSDRPDGCYCVSEDICGNRVERKASSIKNARYSAMEFLEKKGHKELAQKLRPDYRPQRKHLYGYLPCPAVPLAASE